MDLTAESMEPVGANKEQESPPCECDGSCHPMEQPNTSSEPHLQSDDGELEDGNIDEMPAEEESPILVVTPETKESSWLQEVSQAADDSVESVMSADSKDDSDGGSWTLEDGPEAQLRSDELLIEDMQRTIDALNTQLANAALESSSAGEWHREEVRLINRQHIEAVDYQRRQWSVEHTSLLESKKKLADDHVHLQEQYDQAALQLQRQAQEIQDLDKERAVRSGTLSLMEGPGGEIFTYEEREVELLRLRNEASAQKKALKCQITDLETQMENEKHRCNQAIKQVHELRNHQNNLTSNLANERSDSLRQKEQLTNAKAYAAENYSAFRAEQESVRELIAKLASEKESHEETKRTCKESIDEMAKSAKTSVEYQSKLLKESYQKAYNKAADDLHSRCKQLEDSNARCNTLEEQNARFVKEHRKICDHYMAKEKALADEMMMLAKKFNSRELFHTVQRKEWQSRTDETMVEINKLLDINMALEQDLQKERENVVDLLSAAKEDFKANIAILDSKDAIKDTDEQLDADGENGSFLDEKIENQMEFFKRQLLGLNMRVNAAYQQVAWSMKSPCGIEDYAWSELKVHRIKQVLRGIDQKVDALGRKIIAQSGKPTRREVQNISSRLRILKEDVSMTEQEVASLQEIIRTKRDPWVVDTGSQLPASVAEAKTEEAIVRIKYERELATSSEKETRNRVLVGLLTWINDGKKRVEESGQIAECIVIAPLEAKIMALMGCKKSDTADTDDIQFGEIYTWRHISASLPPCSLQLAPLFSIVNEINAHNTRLPCHKEDLKTSLNSLIIMLANTVPHKATPGEITRAQADLKTTFEYCLGNMNTRGYALRILAAFRKEVLSRTQLRQWGVYDAILKLAINAHAEPKSGGANNPAQRRPKPANGLSVEALCNDVEIGDAETWAFANMARTYGDMRAKLRASVERRSTTCEEIEPLLRFNREEFRFLIARYLGGRVKDTHGKDCRFCKSLAEMGRLVTVVPPRKPETSDSASAATAKNHPETPAEDTRALAKRLAVQKYRKVKKGTDIKVPEAVASRDMPTIAAQLEASLGPPDLSNPKASRPAAAPTPAAAAQQQQQPTKPLPATPTTPTCLPPAYEPIPGPSRAAAIAAHRERLTRRARGWDYHMAAPAPPPAMPRPPSPAESVVSVVTECGEANTEPQALTQMEAQVLTQMQAQAQAFSQMHQQNRQQSQMQMQLQHQQQPRPQPTFAPPPSAPITIPMAQGMARNEAGEDMGIGCPSQYVPGQFPESYRFPPGSPSP